MSLCLATSAQATTISIINADGINEGFNDPTIVSPVPGNPATTLGQQRLNVFQAAADYWESQLISNVTIEVQASMDELTCEPSYGILGSAGPESVYRNFTNAPRTNTWYVEALANSLKGSNTSSNPDISTQFNSALDGSTSCLGGLRWWLGIGSPPQENSISLYDTVLHEIGHGLGFVSLINRITGEKYHGYNDAYSYHLYDISAGLHWRHMNDAQRVTSSTNTGNLVWAGNYASQCSNHITQGKNADYIQMYAPSSYQSGSSVSHWDTTLVPDELMEPSATNTSDTRATTYLMKDLGWRTTHPGDISFSSPTYHSHETSGLVPITVSRKCGDYGEVSIQVTDNSETATRWLDYSGVNEVITWPNGASGNRAFSVNLIEDEIDENTETANLVLSLNSGTANLTSPTSTQLRISDQPDSDLCFPIKTQSGKITIICL